MNAEQNFNPNGHEKIDRQWSDEAQDLRVVFMDELKGEDVDLAGDVNGLLNTLLRMTLEEAKDQLQLSIKERGLDSRNQVSCSQTRQSLDSDLSSKVMGATNPTELAQVAEMVIRSIIDKYREGAGEKNGSQDGGDTDMRLAA